MRPERCEHCRRKSAEPRYYCRGCQRYVCSECKFSQVGMSCTQAVCIRCGMRRLREGES